mgnify:CR=1 FL=1
MRKKRAGEIGGRLMNDHLSGIPFNPFGHSDTGNPNAAEQLKLHRKGYDDETKIFIESIDVRPNHFTKQTFDIIRNIGDFRLPEKGEQIRIRTQTQLNLISMLMKIVSVHGGIEELTIATYTFNREAFSVVEDFLVSGRVPKINLFIASSYSFRDKKWFEELKSSALRLSEDYDYHLTFGWSHLKITLAKTGDDYYQFEGSMNYSTNNLAEQTVFENNRRLYEYDYNFIDKIMKNSSHKATEVIC